MPLTRTITITEEKKVSVPVKLTDSDTEFTVDVLVDKAIAVRLNFTKEVIGDELILKYRQVTFNSHIPYKSASEPANEAGTIKAQTELLRVNLSALDTPPAPAPEAVKESAKKDG